MTARRTIALAATTLGLLAPALAHADTNVPEASTTGKGIVGGALLGAEAVTLTEAALGVQPAWAYIVGGIAGAAGGGVGGYFIEQSASPQTTMLMLAGGMLLVIPTTVAILSATAYEPPADYVQDRGPIDEPVAEPAEPDLAPLQSPEAARGQRERPERRRVAAPRLHALPLPPPSLLALDSGRLSLSVPAIELRDVYTLEERMQYGLGHETELRLPVFGLVF
jgi:hypothetical protein